MNAHNRRRHLALFRVFSDPVWSDQNLMIRKIADAVGNAELMAQRALGADWIDAYARSWAATDDAYIMLAGPERQDVLTRFRTYGARA
jgi:hypothetical protein